VSRGALAEFVVVVSSTGDASTRVERMVKARSRDEALDVSAPKGAVALARTLYPSGAILVLSGAFGIGEPFVSEVTGSTLYPTMINIDVRAS
jgi:hypothetical protein